MKHYRRRYFHLQSEVWAVVPQDYSHERVGWSEASWAAREVEDGRRGCSIGPFPACRRTAEASHRHSKGHVG